VKDPIIQDVEMFGSSTQLQVVRAEEGDERDWMGEAPICELLKNHDIAHVGLMWAKRPFEVIRAEATGTFALIGLEGSGEFLIDGSWREVKEGEVCLQPAFAHTGIRAANNKVWSFAWVRYEEKREVSPILSSNSPVIHASSVLGFKYAISGLYLEMTRQRGEKALMHHWVELIHGLVMQASRPYQEDDRLWRVWEAVESDLPRGCVSSEHLRRLCKQHLGRSPIQQVTYLRMRQAVDLLTTSKDKIETIAQAVGYENPFTFSNAFKRWTGRRPTDYREGH